MRDLDVGVDDVPTILPVVRYHCQHLANRMVAVPEAAFSSREVEAGGEFSCTKNNLDRAVKLPT